jgi:hypothetical protein
LSDAPTLITVSLAAIGLGAGALRLAQMALRKNGKSTSGQLSPEIWERKMADINEKVLEDKVIPILKELKEISAKQAEIQQKQNEILIEMVTVSRIGRRTGGN